MNPDVKESLLEFIETTTGTRVNEDSLIFEDLNIDGLDCDSFMEQFSEAFHVDLNGFEINDYCLSEHELGNIFQIIFWAVFKRRKLLKRNFTVTHLIEVIEKGRWFCPDNQNK